MVPVKGRGEFDILFHGNFVGRFDSKEEALGMARELFPTAKILEVHIEGES